MTYLIHPHQLKIQKRMSWFLICFMISMCIVMIGSVIFDREYIQLFMLPLCIILPIQLFRNLNKLNCISFDENALYFGNPEPYHQTELSNIKSITVGRYDLTNRIYLYEPINGERIIHLKSTVIWIPFQSDNTLSKLHQLRDQADRQKKASDEDYVGETRIIQMATLG